MTPQKIKYQDQILDLKNVIIRNDNISFNIEGIEASYKILHQDRFKLFLRDELSGESFSLMASFEGQDYVVYGSDSEATFHLDSKRNLRSKSAGVSGGGLLSPMPGKVFQILKNSGDVVKKGDLILILEAMKMEHPIKADRDGVLKKIFFSVGDQVQGQVVLAEIEEK